MLLTFSIVYAGALVWISALAQHVGNLTSHGMQWVAGDRSQAVPDDGFPGQRRQTVGIEPQDRVSIAGYELVYKGVRPNNFLPSKYTTAPAGSDAMLRTPSDTAAAVARTGSARRLGSGAGRVCTAADCCDGWAGAGRGFDVTGADDARC